MISQVYSLDLSIFRWINRTFNHPVLDQFFNLLADGRFWTPLLLLLALYLLLRGPVRSRAWVILCLLSIAVVDPLLCNPLKHMLDRPRPYQAIEGVREVSPGPFPQRWHPVVRLSPLPEQDPLHGRSFPSSHVANATAAALSARLVWGPTLRWPWLLLALAALGRVYTGDHYPTDVLASIPISLLSTWIICQLTNRAWQKFAPHSLPKWFARLPSLLHSQ